ncbi:hypothetical protein Gpo141_00013550 [Globisporangium polare]
MAPSPKLASPAKRRWSARAWWVGLHVYVYAVLAYNGSLSPSALTVGWFAFAIALAVVNLISYIILQTSSPGFVEPSQRDLEAGGQRVIVDHDAVVSIDECDHASDSEALVRSKSADASDSGLHFCELCQLTQPLRTKHCKDCEKCVRQYDHHCDCAGTCVGEQNRRKFAVYLFIQAVEGIVMISIATDAFTLQDNVDEWFKANWLYIIAWFSVFCVLLIAIPLFLYQAFLISTNQTSWEHARRSAITYLRSLPDEDSPFDRGCCTNWRVFVCGGDANKWVHRASAAPTTVAARESSSSSSSATAVVSTGSRASRASRAGGAHPPLSPDDASIM